MVDSKYIEDLRTKSQLGQLREQSKLIKYSGLLFNELKQPIVTLHEITVSLDPDLRRAGYTFTDGCGRVSADVARTLTAGMFPTPSVLQIRAPGIKGILVMDPQLPKKSIRFRRSMQKLDLLNLSDTPLVKTIGVAVIGVSKPTHCTGLNSDPLRRLYLPIRDSRNLFGICDEFSVLPAGKCYINVAASDGSFQTVTGKVALWRNPCYHPGDIVLLEAVENEKLSHLKNVIVFSVLGSRPAADMCAGGDLDGDTFHVVWDNAIV
ncbi:RNA-dependent RNA polymerase, partial [Chytriomyces sp. MP71]